MTDSLESLLATLDRAARELATSGVRLRRGLEPAVRYVGRDVVGAVAVTVDGTGAVAEVTVAADWASRLDPTGLESAIVAALQTAHLRRAEGWCARSAAVTDAEHTKHPEHPEHPADAGAGHAEHPDAGHAEHHADADAEHAAEADADHVEDADAGRAEAEDTVGGAPAWVAGGLRFDGVGVPLSALLELLRDAEGQLDDLGRAVADAAAGHRTVGRGPVRVSIAGGARGEVTGVEVDRRWLSGAAPPEIGRRVQAAMQAAVDEAGAVEVPGPLREVEELLGGGTLLERPGRLGAEGTGHGAA